MVPSPSRCWLESTEEVAAPTPQGLFGLRAWRFADGAEHLSARALDPDGDPVPAEDGGGERPQYVSILNAPPVTFSVPSDAIAAPQLENGLASSTAPAGTSSTCNHEGRGIGLVNKPPCLRAAGCRTRHPRREPDARPGRRHETSRRRH